jgi:hypothetical protein
MTSPRLRGAGWLVLWVVAALTTPARADDPWVVYPGGEGPGQGKHIVLISGDEEYRSEEALPQLARILATHHGFTCTVLFAIDPKDGTINPNVRDNIPGLEALDRADLLITATRFRDLPDAQMQKFADYLAAGKPVIGLRTATHAFDIPEGKAFARYGWKSQAPGWEGGFGRQVLGETWVAHHGDHGKESTRGVIAPGQESSPLVRGIKSGDIWGPTDVYQVRLPLPGDSTPVILGQVLTGMKADDPALDGPKNNPMMPVAWTKTYAVDGGKTGRVFCTTMGSSTDLASAGLRRLLVNAAYWAVGLEGKIPDQANVDLIGAYHPRPFGFGAFTPGVKPADLR